MLIIKKFKLLRTADQLKASKEGNQGMAARGKWTFSGFKAGQKETSQRKWVDDAVWRQVYEFDYDEQMTPLQAYYMRAAAVHQNVHLHYYLDEEGLESTDAPAPADGCEDVRLRDLADIRDCSAYRAFVSLGGGQVDLNEDGYKSLAKEDRQELKFVGGNLMGLQLREVVDRSVRKLRNFFGGFLTLDQLKDAVGGQPLRRVRPLVTREPKPL